MQLSKAPQFVEVGTPLLHVIMPGEPPSPLLGMQPLDPLGMGGSPEAKVHAPSWRAIISRRWCSASVIPGAARADDVTTAKMAKKVLNCIAKLLDWGVNE